MGQVDEVHHPKNERKSRSDQEQKHTKLKAVQCLDSKKSCAHSTISILIIEFKFGPPGRSRPARF
ncbi:hypothetical protein TRICHSKD4_4114 [Roseibium sp. TrichSKD4]|nr:hypothetical protein TRICHSKD4_4114 [Roseibium sp. TrichSKD4]